VWCDDGDARLWGINGGFVKPCRRDTSVMRGYEGRV
jgi:hypothetical protein